MEQKVLTDSKDDSLKARAIYQVGGMQEDLPCVQNNFLEFPDIMCYDSQCMESRYLEVLHANILRGCQLHY